MVTDTDPDLARERAAILAIRDRFRDRMRAARRDDGPEPDFVLDDFDAAELHAAELPTALMPGILPPARSGETTVADPADERDFERARRAAEAERRRRATGRRAV